MNKNGEIILIEDDPDDLDMFKQAYTELGISNPLVVFAHGKDAYEYFNNTKKDLFLIISDINMPVMSGIQLRDKMQQVGEVRLRTIPFLFLTTGTAPDNILYAYSHSVQGFFQKPNNYPKLKAILKHIFEYWACCTEPNFSNRLPNSL
ncbi:MAG: response regulator [Flavisolibacter sp.]